MIHSVYASLMAVMCTVVLVLVTGLQPLAAADSESSYLQTTVTAWMSVVALLGSDDAQSDRDEDEDGQNEKSQRQHKHHRGSTEGRPHSEMEHGSHGPRPGMAHGRGPGMQGPPGRPPKMPDMNRMVVERLNEVIGRLSRIESSLGGQNVTRRSQAEGEPDRKAQRGPEEMMRQMSDEQRRNVEQRMQEGRQRMEEARKQFNEMKQRIEKLEAEVKKLKAEGK